MGFSYDFNNNTLKMIYTPDPGVTLDGETWTTLMNHQEINCIVPMNMEPGQNGNVLVYYLSGLTNYLAWAEGASNGAKKKLTKKLNDAFDLLGDYLIPREEILMEERYWYVNDRNEIKLICLPVKQAYSASMMEEQPYQQEQSQSQPYQAYQQEQSQPYQTYQQEQSQPYQTYQQEEPQPYQQQNMGGQQEYTGAGAMIPPNPNDSFSLDDFQEEKKEKKKGLFGLGGLRGSRKQDEADVEERNFDWSDSPADVPVPGELTSYMLRNNRRQNPGQGGSFESSGGDDEIDRILGEDNSQNSQPQWNPQQIPQENQPWNVPQTPQENQPWNAQETSQENQPWNAPQENQPWNTPQENQPWNVPQTPQENQPWNLPEEEQDEEWDENKISSMFQVPWSEQENNTSENDSPEEIDRGSEAEQENKLSGPENQEKESFAWIREPEETESEKPEESDFIFERKETEEREEPESALYQESEEENTEDAEGSLPTIPMQEDGSEPTLSLHQEPSVYGALTRLLTGEVYLIRNRTCKIGRRAGEVDIRISNNRTIDMVQCEISCIDGEFYLEDCDSLNGTYYRAVKLAPRSVVKLENRCKIGMADEEFIFIAF